MKQNSLTAYIPSSNRQIFNIMTPSLQQRMQAEEDKIRAWDKSEFIIIEAARFVFFR